MAVIIKYNVDKQGNRVGANTTSQITNNSSSSSSSEGGEFEQLWEHSNGNGSLVPYQSNNTADGVNSIAIGTGTQTLNEGELAVGTYNQSTLDSTLFSVGDGEGAAARHNVFEVSTSGISTTNAVFSGDIQADHAIFESEKVNGLLDANQLQALSGYIATFLSDNITTDYLTVTKAAHFFKLIIDEIKATQGQLIITPANAKLDKVEAITGGWRCYYRATDGDKQISNSFEVNDQVVCQTFNAATGVSYNVSNKYYWRLVTATGSTSTTIDGETVDAHYFDLSESDCDLSSMTPSVGDECVMLGNRTDTNRQAAIIISAYNSEFLDNGLHAPSIVQYAGINNYNLSNHRLNVISNGLNQFKGAYSNNNGQDIEQIITTTANTLNGEITTLSGTVTSHTQSISQLEQTDSSLSSRISANTQSIGTVSSNLSNLSGTVQTNSTNISTLQQTSSSLTSTVSSISQSITTISGNVNSVSGDVVTIQSDYVTSSELSQTASGISATVTNDIEGKLLNTGIDISSNLITMSSDNVQFKTASGSQTWLVGKSTSNYDIFKLGRYGNAQPELWLKESDTVYNHLRPTDAEWHDGSTAITMSVSDGYPALQLSNGGTALYVRVYNGVGQYKVGSATTPWKTIGGGLSVKILTTSSTYTVEDSVDYIVYKSTSADVTINLPSPSSNSGRKIYIKDRSDGRQIKLYGYLCNANSASASYQTISFNNTSAFVISDGEVWSVFYCG